MFGNLDEHPHLTVDYALPSVWIDAMVDRLSAHQYYKEKGTAELNTLIVSRFVWVYPKEGPFSFSGMPFMVYPDLHAHAILTMHLAVHLSSEKPIEEY
jgi:hypothetical protein